MNDQEIIDRWSESASTWIIAVRDRRIRSRVLTADAAIVDAITVRLQRKVLDIGCGEAWRARRLVERGIECT